MPEASAGLELEQAPIIAIDDHGLFLDGRAVDEGELRDELLTLKNNFKLLHPSEPWRGAAILSADRGVDFQTLKRVMYACSVADYRKLDFVVERRAE